MHSGCGLGFLEARKPVTKLNRIGWFELTDRLRFEGHYSDFPTLMLESTPGFLVTWASDSAHVVGAK